MMTLGSALCFAALSAVEFTADNAEVVVEPSAPPAVRLAAKELTTFLSRTLGGDVPCVATPTSGKRAIFLGDSPRARAAGIDVGKLPRDGFVTVADGSSVVIAGRDDPEVDSQDRVDRPWWRSHHYDHATLYGVYDFLERYADVRFYFPGDLGTCVVRKKRISVPAGRREDSPDMRVRTWSFYGDGPWIEGKDRARDCHPVKALNILRQRASTDDLGCCHGLRGFRYVERFGETHPEYFALKKDGTRAIHGVNGDAVDDWSRGHFCYTSGIRDEIFRDCLSYCRGEDASVRGIPGDRPGTFAWGYNTSRVCIDLMPQDGWIDCECPRCEKARRPKGEKMRSTELVWGVVAEVATRLKAEGFEPILTMMSYGPYADVPRIDLPKNVRVMVALTGPWVMSRPEIAEADASYLAAWERKTGCRPWIWTYPNRHPCNGLDIPNVPSWAPGTWGAYYKTVAPHIMGIFAESETDRCIDNLMGYYLLSRIAWDRQTDVGKVMDEFYRRMFGPAAAPMRRALEFVDRSFVNKVAGDWRMTAIGPSANVPSEHRLWCEIYSKEALKELQNAFREALDRASDGSVEARRVRFFCNEMLGPLKRTGDAYRARTDTTAGLAHYAEKRAANLVDDSAWITGPREDRVVSEGALIPPDCLKMTCTAERSSEWYFNRLKPGVRLKPSTRYRLSYFVRTQGLSPTERGGGAGVGFNLEKKASGYSRNWTFPPTRNFLSGDVDWVYQSYEFETPADLPAECDPILTPFIRYAGGTAWFDGVLLEELAHE